MRYGSKYIGGKYIAVVAHLVAVTSRCLGHGGGSRHLSLSPPQLGLLLGSELGGVSAVHAEQLGVARCVTVVEADALRPGYIWMFDSVLQTSARVCKPVINLQRERERETEIKDATIV